MVRRNDRDVVVACHQRLRAMPRRQSLGRRRLAVGPGRRVNQHVQIARPDDMLLVVIDPRMDELRLVLHYGKHGELALTRV
jgi:hypothetical protein